MHFTNNFKNELTTYLKDESLKLHLIFQMHMVMHMGNVQHMKPVQNYIVGYYVHVMPLYMYLYLHFHSDCESLNEPLHLRCGSYLHEQIDLSHTNIHAI